MHRLLRNITFLRTTRLKSKLANLDRRGRQIIAVQMVQSAGKILITIPSTQHSHYRSKMVFRSDDLANGGLN